MGIFTYEALDRSGKSVNGEIEATNRDEAIKKIRAQGQFPRKITGKADPANKAKGAVAGGGKKIKRATGGVGFKKLTMFTRQFSTLIDAGLPIVKSLNILAEQQPKGNLKNCLEGLSEDVSSGKSLSEAMKDYPRIFDNFVINMVRAGEIGGVLDVIFHRLAEFREKSAKLKNKVFASMAYPVLVCTFASGILALIVIFIIPNFEKMFKKQGKTLPYFTTIVLDTAHFLMSPNILFLFAAIGLLIGAYVAIERIPQGKYIMDNIKNKLPIIGLIRRKSGIAIFCRTLGTLIASGVSILEALSIIKLATRNAVIVEDIGKIYDSIREGESIADPLRTSKVFDRIVADMVAVGEETGELDKMLLKIAENYEDETDTLVSSLMSMLEPVMIIGMAVSIGSIVIALFLPIIQMMDDASKG
jgi:type IV pilus assembly protein PilC